MSVLLVYVAAALWVPMSAFGMLMYASLWQPSHAMLWCLVYHAICLAMEITGIELLTVVQSWHAVLLLLQSQALAALGRLQEACQTCLDGMTYSTAVGWTLQPGGQAAQVTLAALAQCHQYCGSQLWGAGQCLSLALTAFV